MLYQKKATRNQALQQKSHQRDKHLGSHPCKVVGTILNKDKGEIQIEIPTKKIDVEAESFTSAR